MEIEALDNYFGYTEKGSSFENEIRAGIATFLTMAYILVVNPAMLAMAGIPFDDALFATALAAFIGCMVMGLWANLPFASPPEWVSTRSSCLVLYSQWVSDGNSLSPRYSSRELSS